jgi:hypothetical protein
MRGKLLELHQVSAMCSRWLPVPPLTSTLLGSVEKSRSGMAAGVLNSTRQPGSVLGVALFGSLAGQACIADDLGVPSACSGGCDLARRYKSAGGQHPAIAPRSHSITLSARSRSPAGISWPIAFAVLRLMTISKVEGCSTGTSEGLAPRSTLVICRARCR